MRHCGRQTSCAVGTAGFGHARCCSTSTLRTLQREEYGASSLDLRELDVGLFSAHPSKLLVPPGQKGRVFGGQVLGQALHAASTTVPDKRILHSVHAYFLKAGRRDRPIIYHVDSPSTGRTFASRSVQARQAGETIFQCQASFQAEELPGALSHTLPMPDVAMPEELPTVEELLADCHSAPAAQGDSAKAKEARAVLDAIAEFWQQTPIEIKVNMVMGWYTNWKNLPMMLIPLPHHIRWACSMGAAGVFPSAVVVALNYGVFEACNELTDMRVHHRRAHGLTAWEYVPRIAAAIGAVQFVCGLTTFAGLEELLLTAGTLSYFPVLSKFVLLKDAYAVVVGVLLHTRVSLAVAIMATGCNLGRHEPMPWLSGLGWVGFVSMFLMGMQDLDDVETDTKEGRFTWARKLDDQMGVGYSRKVWTCLFAVIGICTFMAQWQPWQSHPVDQIVGALWFGIAAGLYRNVEIKYLLPTLCISLAMLCIPASLQDVQHLSSMCHSD